MMQKTLEAMRLEAQIARDMDAYQKIPRRKLIGAQAKEYRFARYVEDWRMKVERIGNLNYPEAARQKKLYGSLILTVFDPRRRQRREASRSTASRASGSSTPRR